MLINTLSKKNIGSTTTNHGADMAISRRTDIQHDGHSQAFPRYKRRQTMDGTHCIHIHAVDARYHTQNTISMYHIKQYEREREDGPLYVQGTTLATKAYRLEQAKQDVCMYRPLVGLVEHDDSVLREIGVYETLSQHHSVCHVLDDRLLTRAVLEPNRVSDLRRRITICRVMYSRTKGDFFKNHNL